MKKFVLLILVALIGILLLALVSCQGITLTVTFDAGEYGVAEGQLTQTVGKRSQINEPRIIPNEGYIFIGYDRSYRNLPDKGKFTLTAEYAKVECWWVDSVTHERLEDNGFLDLPFLEGIILPHIEVRVTNMQNGLSNTEISRLNRRVIIGCNKTIDSIAPAEQTVIINITITESDELIIQEKNYGLFAFSTKEDWTANLEVAIYDTKSFSKTMRQSVVIDHDRVVEIEVTSHDIYLEEVKTWFGGDPPPLVHAGSIVSLFGMLQLESGSSRFLNFMKDDIVYVIERIWSIYGDDLEPEDFSSYAYSVSAAESELAGFPSVYIQLTDLLDVGWVIEVHVYHPVDDIRSNTWTINIR